MVLEVEPRAEAAAGAGEHGDPGVVVGGDGAEGVGQRQNGVERHRVQPLGTVHHDQADVRAGLLDGDVAHDAGVYSAYGAADAARNRSPPARRRHRRRPDPRPRRPLLHAGARQPGRPRHQGRAPAARRRRPLDRSVRRREEPVLRVAQLRQGVDRARPARRGRPRHLRRAARPRGRAGRELPSRRARAPRLRLGRAYTHAGRG